MKASPESVKKMLDKFAELPKARQLELIKRLKAKVAMRK